MRHVNISCIKSIGCRHGCRVIRSAQPAEVDVDEELCRELVGVGRITMPHGVRGQLKVLPLTDDPTRRLGTPGKRWLAPRKLLVSKDSGLREVELVSGKESVFKGMPTWVVSFQGINSREEAEQVKNYYIMINIGDRQALDNPDEFYVQELIGLQVRLSNEESYPGLEGVFGEVIDVLKNTGSRDVLRIQLSKEYDNRTILIPFEKSMVPIIDLESHLMTIDPPEGLLDIYLKPKKAATRK
eukprot:TRINITY_DN59061_c0_g1_i7.p4 TRINITY_DN59061_c0_g1~~TRINITY_DN59061_c0_g1_i7.p4  ORF type:complete len:241 (-),score=32.74 TRINITY_DN59061_c0_g1_i7:287-1009(-)